MKAWFFFFFLLEVASAPTELKLFTEQALGPGGGGLPLHVLLLLTLSHTECVLCMCIFILNAAIQNCESNHHSGKTVLQVWATLLMWSNH